jgi:hypothetical protein
MVYLFSFYLTLSSRSELKSSLEKKMSQVAVTGTGEPTQRSIFTSMKCLSFKQIIRIVEQSEKEPWGE